MDHGWYRLHRGATGHGSDATACTPGRVVWLEVSRSAAWGSSWQASAGVRDEEKINRRSKLCALAPIMSYFSDWRLSRARVIQRGAIFLAYPGFFQNSPPHSLVRAHGSGVQRPGWRSLGRSMDQCHLNWVCTECAHRSRQGPDPSVWSGEGPRSRWKDRVFRGAEGLPLQRAAQDRDTCSGHGRTGATGPPCAGLQNATTHMPTPDVGGRWPTAIVPRHRRCREAFATTRRPRRRR